MKATGLCVCVCMCVGVLVEVFFFLKKRDHMEIITCGLIQHANIFLCLHVSVGLSPPSSASQVPHPQPPPTHIQTQRHNKMSSEIWLRLNI